MFGNLLNKPPLLVFGIIFRFRDVAFNIPTLISNRREKKVMSLYFYKTVTDHMQEYTKDMRYIR